MTVTDIPRDPVPLALFGRDHWSTFAYAETCVVDGGGVLEPIRMRCDRLRHPQFAHLPAELEAISGPCPTRLRHGSELKHHDDWDCLDDIEAAGLIEQRGSGLHRIIVLTEDGLNVAASLRQHRASCKTTGSAWASFVVPYAEAPPVPSTPPEDPPGDTAREQDYMVAMERFRNALAAGVERYTYPVVLMWVRELERSSIEGRR